MRGRDNGPGGAGGKAELGNLKLIQVRNSQGLDLGGLRGCFKDSLKTIFSLKFKKKKSVKGRSHLDKIPLCSMKFLEARPIQDAITIIQPKDICLHVLLASQPPWQHPGLSGK